MSNTQRTPQQALKDAIESGAVQAFANGKKIQVAQLINPNEWLDLTHQSPNFSGVYNIWRPAPEPKLRPWKNANEVQKHAIYRDKHWDKGCWSLVVGVSTIGIHVFKHNASVFIRFNQAFKDGEHSLDGGKTWLPCGVMEESK